MRRIVELDGLRAFAVAGVMACHYYPFSTMFFKLPEFGWAGVDFFFVLSGFLITGILLNLKNRPHSYRVFYARRILRIFPPYYAVIFLIYAVAMCQHESFAWDRFVGKVLFLQSFNSEFSVLSRVFHHLTVAQPIADPFAVTALPAASKGFAVPGFSSSSGPTWSLSIEEWFYILWAPPVLHLRRGTLCFTCIAVCVAALLLRWLGFLGILSYFDFFSRIDVLMFGSLLALWMEQRLSLTPQLKKRGDLFLSTAAILAAAGLAAIFFAIRPVLGREIRESPLFMVFGFPLLAFCFAGLLSHVVRHQAGDGLLCRFLRLKPFVVVGTVSYTLYLVHVPIYMLVNQAASKMGADVSRYNSSLLISTISAVVSFLIALLSFKFFETPILSYKDKLTERLTR